MLDCSCVDGAFHPIPNHYIVVLDTQYPVDLWVAEYVNNDKLVSDGDPEILPNVFKHFFSLRKVLNAAIIEASHMVVKDILEDKRVGRVGYDCIQTMNITLASAPHRGSPSSGASTPEPGYRRLEAELSRSLRQPSPFGIGVDRSHLKEAVAQSTVTPSGGLESEPIPWHLDRLDGGNSTDPMDGVFHYNAAAGDGVRVYVVDAGVARHDDLAANLVISGFPNRFAIDSLAMVLKDAYNQDEWNEGGVFWPSSKRSSHGTHVASTIGGREYGVAKHAQIVSAQVLQNLVALADGQDESVATGPVSLFLLSLEWILEDCQATAYKCVINLSYGGRFSGDLFGWFSIPESALRTVEAHGILVVKAAGNDGGAACNVYPAASRSGLSVGAVGRPDETAGNAHHIAWFSNFGCCSDLFAPGVEITAASAVSPNATLEASGTSMATAMTSGVAALLWSEHLTSSSDQLYVSVLCLAATNVVAGVCPCDGGTCVQGSSACQSSDFANMTLAQSSSSPADDSAALADALATPNRFLFNGAGLADGTASRVRYLQCLGFDRGVWGYKPCLIQDANVTNSTNGTNEVCENMPNIFNTSGVHSKGTPGWEKLPSSTLSSWNEDKVSNGASDLLWPQAFHYYAINSTWVWAGDCESGIEHWAAELQVTQAGICTANLSAAIPQIAKAVRGSPGADGRIGMLADLPLSDGISPSTSVAVVCAYTCSQVGVGPCVPDWDPHPVAEVGGCHPSGSILDVEGQGPTRIEDVAVGMRVHTPFGFEPVVGRLHAEHGVTREYFRIGTSFGQVRISPLHWLYCNGQRCDPADLKVGDELTTPGGGRARVNRVDREWRLGAYHITTPSGTYFVDGHLASTYMAVVPFWAWRVFGDFYVYARHMIGIPVTPEGEGPVSIFWPYALWALLRVPTRAVPYLWPLTMIGTLFAELVNTVYAHLFSLGLGIGAGALSWVITSRSDQRAAKAARKIQSPFQ